jgi:long-chain acyl-CoA synthetase
MEKIWKQSWPAAIPPTLSYLAGERPIHDYLRLRAREMPEKAALIYYGRQISYAELDTASDRFGAWLAAKGVVKGDRVGIFMGNSPQYVIAHFGAQKIGAIVCPCSPLFKEMELEHELCDAGVKVLVAWDLLMPIAQKVLPRTEVALVVATNLNDYLPPDPHAPLPEMMQVP